MTEGWEVGDLAVCVAVESLCGFCEDDGDPRVTVGSVVTVTAIFPPQVDGEPIGFDFAEAPVEPPEEWCSCVFRKLDRREPCDEEFRILLDLSKRRVTA